MARHGDGDEILWETIADQIILWLCIKVSFLLQFNINYFQNEPVFYNSLGQPISREEAGFSQEESSEFEGLNREEQEAYLQWEAENLLSQQQWNDQGGDNYDNQWQDNYINDQQFSDFPGDGFVPQPWSTEIPEYTRWSSSGYNQ